MLRRRQARGGDPGVLVREAGERVRARGAHLQHVRAAHARGRRSRRLQLYNAGPAEYDHYGELLAYYTTNYKGDYKVCELLIHHAQMAGPIFYEVLCQVPMCLIHIGTL